MKTLRYRPLTPNEEYILVHKGTEAPGSGIYNNNTREGEYLCKRCEAPLYRSKDQFHAACGWPSFDDEIPHAIQRIPDADGKRTEIRCASCGGHLGHIFEGEQLTDKNVRHCVNSLALLFKPTEVISDEKEIAVFAGGCFWGMEYHFAKQKGVLSCISGYAGGTTKNPSYEEVCQDVGGHAEVIEVTFDPRQVDFLTLCKLFFEIHDPCQEDGQGPDLGNQYRSEVFYTNERQKEIAQELIAILHDKGYPVITLLTPLDMFWAAEDYHQNYYQNKGTLPYCHAYTQRF